MAKKYIDADLLKKEIKRLKDEYTDIAIDSQKGWVNANFVIDDLEQLLSQIDSLQQEQQENKPSLLKSLEEYFAKTPKEQLDTDWEKLEVWNEIGPDVETYCKTQREQQEVDLEKEIEKELRLHYNNDQDVYWWNYLKKSFRYFYELGKNSE